MSVAEKLVTIAQNEQKVYEQGRTDEKTAFWTQFQRWNGSTCARKSYTQAFMNWGASEIKPLYTVENATTDLRYAFYSCNITSTDDLNFSSWTFSDSDTPANNTQYMFHNCKRLTYFDWYSQFKFYPKNINSIFGNCINLKSILNLPISNITTANNAFKGCSSLEDITFYNYDTFNLDADGLYLDFSDCVNLSDRSMHQINSACCGTYNTYEGTATKTIKFPSNAEEKFIANNPSYGGVDVPWEYYLHELQDYGGWTVIY